MASSFTYASIKTAFESWLEDTGTDFDGDFPTMLGLAEDRVLKDLDLTIFDTVSAVTINSAAVTKPTGAIVTRQLYIASLAAFLYPRTWAYCLARYGATSGVPKAFVELNDTQYGIYPTPSISYSGTALITKRPSGLQTDTSGTFLSLRVGDTLFRALICQAGDYLEMEERKAALEAEYQNALGSDEKKTGSRWELRELRRRDYGPFARQPSPAGQEER